MPRGAKCRFVGFYPPFVNFRPEGSGFQHQETIIVKVEEIEAIRLKDYLKLEQEEGARRMRISRPTFQRILGEARFKIADALLNGKAIKIEGGDFCMGSGYCWRYGRSLRTADNCSMRPFLEELENESDTDMNLMTDSIAVCAAGEQADSLIDERFGRCPYVVIWDRAAGFKQAINNSNTEMGHGAGIGTAQIVLSQRTGTVLTNKIGPKGYAVLKQAGVEIYACSGKKTVAEAVQQYIEGALPRLKAANN